MAASTVHLYEKDIMSVQTSILFLISKKFNIEMDIKFSLFPQNILHSHLVTEVSSKIILYFSVTISMLLYAKKLGAVKEAKQISESCSA